MLKSLKTPLLGFALLGLAAVWISCSSDSSPVSPSASKALTDDGTGSTATTNVAFTDANLEAAVRAALGTNAPATTDSLTTAHLQLLTVLDGRDRNIQSLEGLQHATALDTLNLTKNSISNLSPLASLTNLKALSLNQNSITDLSPLASLTNLKRLEATENSISDVSSLASLTNLEYLVLTRNSLADADLTPLASLATNLKYLGLQRSGIRDVGPLANLVNLEELDLYTNRIQDARPLASLDKLKGFAIGGNYPGGGERVGDYLVDVVKNMLDLEWLKVNASGLRDISFLEKLTKLEDLDISGNNGITDFKPLTCLLKLKNLYIRSIPRVIDAAGVYDIHVKYLVDRPDVSVRYIGAFHLFAP